MIRLASPTFTAADRERIDEVLTSGQLVQGRFVAQFERTLAERLGLEVIACSSGTAALHIAMMALDLRDGDEVVVPAFTWPSTAHVIVRAGGTPVFADIDPDTLNVDPDSLDRAITPRTRALLPVHLFGIPAPMRRVMDAARSCGADVVEDAACALGTVSDLGVAGTIGKIGCFSLHPRKIITTGEGGLLTTTDTELAERLRSLRNHGMVRTADGIVFNDLGLNYRLTELGGALGIGQLEQLDHIIAVRAMLGRHYLARLASVAAAIDVRVPSGLADPGNAFQNLAIDVGNSQRRARIMAHMLSAGVETTIGTYAVHEQPIYVALGFDPAACPNASHAMRSLLALPLHHAMTVLDVDRVVEALVSATRAA